MNLISMVTGGASRTRVTTEVSIISVRHSQENAPTEPAAPPSDAALELDAARLAMLRDVRLMSIEHRLDLFDRLQRDAAWARGAKRVR